MFQLLLISSLLIPFGSSQILIHLNEPVIDVDGNILNHYNAVRMIYENDPCQTKGNYIEYGLTDDNVNYIYFLPFWNENKPLIISPDITYHQVLIDFAHFNICDTIKSFKRIGKEEFNSIDVVGNRFFVRCWAPGLDNIDPCPNLPIEIVRNEEYIFGNVQIHYDKVEKSFIKHREKLLKQNEWLQQKIFDQIWKLEVTDGKLNVTEENVKKLKKNLDEYLDDLRGFKVIQERENRNHQNQFHLSLKHWLIIVVCAILINLIYFAILLYFDKKIMSLKKNLEIYILEKL